MTLASLAGFDVYTSARQKIDLIESLHLRAGARVDLSAPEVNAFVMQAAPTGVRNPKIVLKGTDLVTGSALVDFGKVRRGQGIETGWLLSKLLDGERNVSATARVRSGSGKIRVDVVRLSISGLEVDGKTLDFLLQNFVLPFYPDAIVGRDVPLGYRIDRLQLAPAGVGILIGR